MLARCLGVEREWFVFGVSFWSAGTVVPAPPGPAAVGFGGETTVGGVDRASASAARVLPFAPGPSYFGFSPITGISTEFELLSRKSLPIK